MSTNVSVFLPPLFVNLLLSWRLLSLLSLSFRGLSPFFLLPSLYGFPLLFCILLQALTFIILLLHSCICFGNPSECFPIFSSTTLVLAPNLTTFRTWLSEISTPSQTCSPISDNRNMQNMATHAPHMRTPTNKRESEHPLGKEEKDEREGDEVKETTWRTYGRANFSPTEGTEGVTLNRWAFSRFSTRLRLSCNLAQPYSVQNSFHGWRADLCSCSHSHEVFSAVHSPPTLRCKKTRENPAVTLSLSVNHLIMACENFSLQYFIHTIPYFNS